MAAIKKHWMKILIFFSVLILSVALWIWKGFETFLTTIIAGLLVGLCSSFVITYLFEREKKKSREDIRRACIESFVYSCADYILNLESWYKDYSKSEYSILENPEVMLNFLQELRDNHKKVTADSLNDQYATLVKEYTYSVGPIYYAYKQLDNQQLLLGDILSLNEYHFFHNNIRRDMFDDFKTNHNNDRFAQRTSGYYVFHQLRICLNCALEATKIFPEIKVKYNTLKTH